MDSLSLPVGTHPGWEYDESSDDSGASDGEPQGLRSIAESLVVYQSLRQSRNRWLSSAFPKFSAKSRGGKPPEVVPPPHSIKAHGRFDVRIGPHVFPETTFYEVYYLPDATTGVGPSSSQPPAFHAYQNQDQQKSNAPSSTAQVAVSALSSSPEARQDFSDSSVTPDLVFQVSAAAATNPVLKDLLQLAASDKATSEQKKTLADLIRSMGAASKPSQPMASQPMPVKTHTHAPIANPRPAAPMRQVRDFDVVIEFQEKPSDRWIVPRHSAVCERPDTHSDILLFTPIAHSPPELSQTDSSDQVEGLITPQVVTMRISNASVGLWELLFRWAGGEEGIAKGKAALKNIIDKQPPRTYLRYQLSDGPLLEQLQNTVPPRYNMKSIAPANSNSSRSRKRSRKHREPKAQVTGTTFISMSDGKRKSKARAIEPAAPISCRSCGRADVPLLNFGRYCKDCINTGRPGNPATAPSHNYSSSGPAAPSPRAYAKPAAAVVSPQQYTKSAPAVAPPQPYPTPAAAPVFQSWPQTGYTPYGAAPQPTPSSSSRATPVTKGSQHSTTTATTTEIVPVVVQTSPNSSHPRVTTHHETKDLT